MHAYNLRVSISPREVANFNSSWPGSELRSSRSYWFEFDGNEDLVDTDCPESDDGSAAVAMAEDCKKWLFEDASPSWEERG